MSIEVTPVGVTCNLSCPYCYEHPMRDAGNYTPGYDLAAMKRGLEAEGGEFTLFGGEPLLMPLPDLEDLLAYSHKCFGRSGIQTNGALITNKHVELFTRYNTHVGLSLDGPDELNDSRWAGTLEKTRAATEASFAALDALLVVGRPPSIIVTLYRGNATAERLPKLLAWFKHLDARGVSAIRIHLLEVDNEQVRNGMALTEEENVHALLALMKLQNSLQRVRFDLFDDMAKLLLTGKASTCIWNGCDPLTTPAVRSVNAVGGRTNCSRTNKDGIDWVKANSHGAERYLMLHQTPQADGGCKDCKFFFACKGNCPGTALKGDWRNRSEHCQVWYRIFEVLERQLLTLGRAPISADKVARDRAEHALIVQWAAGLSPEREHGDHWDAPDGYSHSDNGFSIHGDAGTTETHHDVPHQDHYDA